jgi:hypothetical protein
MAAIQVPRRLNQRIDGGRRRGAAGITGSKASKEKKGGAQLHDVV